jgi:tetratricopeptide (TPR) repeat protein
VSNIFISYRRDDSRDIAERICDHLSARFGDKHVFQDVVDIAPGLPWDEAIDVAIQTSDTVLVIIGDAWLNATKDGARRLDNPSDELRQEVARALARPATRIIPVLVGNAAMPDAADLPEDLKGLALRQAKTLRGGEHFQDDVKALANAIGPPTILHRGWIWPAAAAAVVGALAVAVVVVNGGGANTAEPTVVPTTTPQLTTATTTAAVITTEATPSPTTVVTTVVPADTNAQLYRTTPLTGAFNVAVLGFAAEPADDQNAVTEATNSANELVRFLTDGLAQAGSSGSEIPDIDVGLFAPAAAGSPEASDMQSMADRWNADVVVTATLQSIQPNGGTFVPTFAVRAETTSRQLQLAGSYGLGAASTFTVGFEQPAVRQQLRTTLERRACVLVHLVLGLSNYRARIDDVAKSNFEQAINGCGAADSVSSGSEGQEIADLYLGSLALLANDLPTADAWYDRALVADPRYARALFGKAEVAFQQARATTCDATGDGSALRSSLAANGAAFDAYNAGLERGETPVPYLADQAHLQAGRAQLCLGLVDPSVLSLAGVHLQQVVSDYLVATGESKAGLAGLASEAYAGLGYLDVALSNGAGATAALDKLDRALALNPAPDRAVVFRSFRAFLNDSLGRSTDAVKDCALVTALGTQRCPMVAVGDFLLPFTGPLAFPATGSPATAMLMTLASLLLVAGVIMVRLAATNRRRLLRSR